MLREFVDLVNEAVNDGYERGIGLFLESLETDLAKDEIYESYSVDAVVGHLFEQAGVEVELTEENLEGIDDEKLDQLLKEMEEDDLMDEPEEEEEEEPKKGKKSKKSKKEECKEEDED